ncbi:myo-inositol 2-dehydrogenase [Prolixibacter denitrificans]|uniref:Myo-inositol 2-dehydrogenase n=1 Tax=Prolixibacter denitrificans TaxID=1541063 RepID=A0A2P8C8R1_9BACT|nr:myo-inositol 2-dehydrogenase [Prolixibacter denitrificans]PSK81339.1 hypothetical protein CLV93_110123 [Prolixibacter denitrificans]GET21576.1 hypothetical protein JCM18694_18220 [Prolixibacter denitrificans]
MGNNKTWLVGASQMAVEYTKVLKALGEDFLVIGRGNASAINFYEQTNIKPITGGIENFINSKPEKPNSAIVSVGIEKLKFVTELLIRFGIKKILVEKPGGLNINEVIELNSIAKTFNAIVFIGYNRRFYSSVIKSKEIIQEDGGLKSFNFEFTEWSHVIQNLKKAPGVKESWFIGNSSHVIDTAFYIGGKPKQMSSYTSGELSWHKPTIFAGAGITNQNALFNYSANWEAPGRWSIEFLTSHHRLILRPLEKLQIQNIGSIATEFVVLDYQYDENFKPGLYLQTKAFLDNDYSNLCTLDEQVHSLTNYYKEISK